MGWGRTTGRRWQWCCRCPKQDTEILDSAVYRSRANLGRKRGHRAPAIRPGGTLGLSEAADSDARLFQDSTGRASEFFDVCVDVGVSRVVGAWGCSLLSPPWALAEPRASRVPSSDEEVVEEPQNRRTRMSLGTKGLKVNLFPGLSPSALKVPFNDSADTPLAGPLNPAFLFPIIYSFPHLFPIPPLIPLSMRALPDPALAVC